jgi:alkanesulfonate monooxygenase SsuD/methylene tetrahydromethanopterin reductase-like flavin-dependent oxidoreductase (luciferase family)
MKIGYFLSSEETAPRELVHQASLAEQAGFDGLWISDHFHPWNDRATSSPPSAGVPTVAVLSGGFSEAELRDAGAREVYESVAELRERLERWTS